MAAIAQKSDNVFINCPFDSDYKPLFDAIVFAIFDFGFVPRCSLEVANIANRSGRKTLPGGTEIFRRYNMFQNELPALCAKLKIQLDELTYFDYTTILAEWLDNESK